MDALLLLAAAASPHCWPPMLAVCLQVQVHTDAGVLCADAALVTIPLGVLKRADGLAFLPPLPARKRLAIKRLGFGCLNKVMMLFPHCFWGDKVGGCWGGEGRQGRGPQGQTGGSQRGPLAARVLSFHTGAVRDPFHTVVACWADRRSTQNGEEGSGLPEDGWVVGDMIAKWPALERCCIGSGCVWEMRTCRRASE